MIPEWCLSRVRAEAMVRELEALHPHVGARAVYSYGTGGYVVLVDSPNRSQDEVAVVSEAAYKVLLAMRADAWRRLPMPRDNRHQQTERTSLMQISRLRNAEAAEEAARTGHETDEGERE